ncbi:histidine phosphatase superfamily [Talaromyces proteolyticus]|uniref:Histidine phosphatase superfamily n=1 Tax=Talaromyces proteolyticus TaxID=1131652 RepID=A0AAD4PYP6_9EURO|nr:histidine phosphatase superfamily [Talaromyces proteolyticus]KAH8695383.1 histidine phosphatase superfamily [Talaromyces proteolyticus]
MGKPRMIILIRHAQSEGNKNREIHQSVPDHRVKLTAEGHMQALEAGRRLRELLRPDDTLHFYTSPYRRTRETTENILESLTSDDPSPSPFPRHTIKVYEEPRLREQDFGNFQPCSAEMSRMWRERADYGHFFYRIPNGESAADAYDRVSGFNESLWRLFGEDSFASVCVLVTHGLMARVFLMKWYHFSVEYFEDLRNVNHCEFVIMEKNPDNGKYILQNKLRTWSALRREKEEERKRERELKGLPPTPAENEVPVRRKWGGCPDGCTHGVTSIPTTWRPARQDKADLFRDDDGGETTDARNRSPSAERKKSAATMRINHHGKPRLNSLPIEISADDIISSPDQTPSYISLAGIVGSPNPSSVPEVSVTAAENNTDDHHRHHHHHHHHQSHGRAVRKLTRGGRSSISPLRLSSSSIANEESGHLLHMGGRDGGGSKSGVNSPIPSDSEENDAMLPEGSKSLPQPTHTVQDAEDDGDDEGAGSRRTIRRHKPAYYHPVNSAAAAGGGAPFQLKANALGDADSASSVYEEDGAQQADNEDEDDDNNKGESNREFDQLRKQEESVGESVY